MRGYVFYGSVPWTYMWLTEQNLAHALADRHPVLHVDPPMSAATPFRYGRRESTPTSLAHRKVRREGRVDVVRPVVLPPVEHPVARRLSAPLVKRRIRKAAAGLEAGEQVVVSARWAPGLEGALRPALRVHLVKDWNEAGAAVLGRSREELRAEVGAACAGAGLVCATSRRLVQGLAERGHEAVLLRHGFHADMAAAYDSPAPAAYADLPRPLMAFAGTIDGRLDFPLLEVLADRFPDGTILLIGRVSPRLDRAELDALAGRPNVRLMGPFTREQLPPHLGSLDCSLLPYKEDEWGRYGSPLKLWDYLYAGPPVVGCGYLELEDYPPPLVQFARGAEAFVQAVEAAIAAGAEGREERRSYALANTWDQRAQELDALVTDRLGR